MDILCDILPIPVHQTSLEASKPAAEKSLRQQGEGVQEILEGAHLASGSSQLIDFRETLQENHMIFMGKSMVSG